MAYVLSATRSQVYTFPSASLRAGTAASTFGGVVPVTATDRATNRTVRVFTVARDATPPQVWLDVPARVSTGVFTITWGASDAQAGVAWYDLDVSVDGGPWQRVLTRTQATSYVQTCTPAHFYTFRVTATDRVSNAVSVEARASVPRTTKYYHHGGVRIALRAQGVVYYLHGDHLGSISLLTDHASRITAQQRFLPYGGVRWQEGTFPTDVGFTGHRGHPDLGLVFMRARYYHSGLGRFVSADSIVPEPSIPVDLNRYAYVRNSPLRYVDPTGHLTDDELKTLLGDDYSELMDLWNKYDPYWVAVLKELQVGGILWASMLGDLELHIESGREGIRAVVYNGTFSSRLEEWQGRGAYRIRNPGMTDEESYRLRDRLFDQYECGLPNTVVVPVFNYRPLEWRGDDTLRPVYLGARAIYPGLGEFQSSSLSEEVAKLLGASEGNAQGVSTGVGIALTFIKKTPSWVGPTLVLTDFALSIYATYRSPKQYSVGWPGALDVNPYIALERLAH